MGRSLTVTLPDERYATVETMVESGEASSKSEAVNQLMDRGERVNELEARNDELERKLAHANARNDHVEQLAEYVEGERELQREERERRRAPFLRRLKWWWFGRE